jgi:hypothetical protein
MVVACSLALAACGSSGGSEPAATTEAAAASTTEAAAPTTTAADDEEPAADEDGGDEGALPSDEADAPSGDWVSVRFNVAAEPEPEDFNPGSAEARLYDVTPTCDGDGPCELELAAGGEGGSYAMPDVEPITGEPITLEPEGSAWVDSYEYPDAVGCTAELDGPYLETFEERSLEPVLGDDGEIIGLVGTVLFTDTLNAEGRAAGCPASSEATWAYAVVMAPSDGVRAIDEYSVNGTFRETLEVTASEGQVNDLYQPGGISTSLPDYDIDLAGSCSDGECSVEFAQQNGDGDMRRVELLSEDGRGLLGTYEEEIGCTHDVTGEVVFDGGAYEATGAYEDLTPIWIEDGEVKAFIGRYYRVAEPTELGETDPSCRTTQTIEAWTYLVDTDVLG